MKPRVLLGTGRRIALAALLLVAALPIACGGAETKSSPSADEPSVDSPPDAATADGPDAATEDGSSNRVTIGDASGTVVCADGAATCGCTDVLVLFPLDPHALDTLDAGDGGSLSAVECARVCPPSGGQWFSCRPLEDGGATFVACQPLCL
jgi:hypothetical protein